MHETRTKRQKQYLSEEAPAHWPLFQHAKWKDVRDLLLVPEQRRELICCPQVREDKLRKGEQRERLVKLPQHAHQWSLLDKNKAQKGLGAVDGHHKQDSNRVRPQLAMHPERDVLGDLTQRNTRGKRGKAERHSRRPPLRKEPPRDIEYLLHRVAIVSVQLSIRYI